MISLLWAVAFFSMFAASQASAAEWRIEPLFRVGAEFDDNAILTTRTDQDTEISGYVVEGSAMFAYSTERSTLSLTPRFMSRNYDAETYDSNDQFLDFDLGRITQSSNFRVRGNYTRQSVRTAERSDADLDVVDPDEIPDDDSGLIAGSARRETLRLFPQWSYRVSDASLISADIGFTDTSYDDEIGRDYIDYSNVSASLSYQRDWSQRNSAFFSGYYRKYMPDAGDDGTGVGLHGGLERRLNETTRFRALVGLENTEQGINQNDVDWVADVRLTRRLQTITMLAQYRRSSTGGGAGKLNVRDTINVNFTRNLSELISAGLGVRAYRTTALDEADANFDERSYLQLRARFTWNLTPNWAFETDYRYTFSDRGEVGESANSNNIMIWLNYRPTPVVRSR